MTYHLALTGKNRKVWDDTGEKEHVGWCGDKGDFVVFRADGLRSYCADKCPENHMIDVRNILEIPPKAAQIINFHIDDEDSKVTSGEMAADIEEEWQAAVVLEVWLNENKPKVDSSPTQKVNMPRSEGAFTI